MLGLGFTVGWLVKPDHPLQAAPVAVGPSAPKSETATVAPPSAEAPGPGKRAQRDPVVKKPSGVPTEAQMDQAKKMQADMAQSMVKRQRDKIERQIERLTAKLNLTPDQKAGLTTWLDAQMKKFENLDFTDPKSMTGLSDLFSSKGLEDQLASTLTADQQAALVDFKEGEHRGKVDAAALKSLSKLQGILEFEEGQRDEVYKILTQNAEASVLAEAEKPDVTKMFTEGMGIEMDPYDLGLQQAMTDSMMDLSKGGADTGDQKQMAVKMREIIDKRIEEKVSQLRPVLNEKQLDQYRSELKSKGLGVYGSILTSMESGAIAIPHP